MTEWWAEQTGRGQETVMQTEEKKDKVMDTVAYAALYRSPSILWELKAISTATTLLIYQVLPAANATGDTHEESMAKEDW